MSIEPTCIYCGASDKFRCRTQDEADTCKAYKRQKALLQLVDRTKRLGKVLPDVEAEVTVEEIDRAIDILKRVKQQIGAQNE